MVVDDDYGCVIIETVVLVKEESQERPQIYNIFPARALMIIGERGISRKATDI